jgi:cyclophilin family peptidyl-prolyl cis-trans isomerase
MRLIQQQRRRAAGRRKLARVVGSVCVVDRLEKRQMLSAEALQSPIPSILASTANPSANSITLNQHFFDSAVPGTLVQFSTGLGNIIVSLTDTATPNTVANFLSYVNNPTGDNYDSTFFHRSVDLNTNVGGSPSAPATIIQGGGYTLQNGSIGHITTASPVADEYQTEILKDTAGTLAMAKTSDPNSATSEWYFNAADNTELDVPTTVNGVQTSYTVFGTVLSGMSVVSQIAALPTTNGISGLTDVPVTGLTEAQLSANAQISANNLVFTNTVTTEAVATYTATSDNKSLVTPTITNGVLSFTYGAGASGTADITVTAKNNWDGTTASATFAVTVPNSATPTAGPVANPVTAPSVVTGSSGTFGVLSSDTDSLAALNPSSVQIVGNPQHGTASVNSSTGFITYTPTSGYIGADTLSYTVTDALGNVSPAATVTLAAVPPAATITLGAGKGSTLKFTQPDGITGTLTVSHAKAVITFSSYQVTEKFANGTIIATGAGTTITNITMTNFAFTQPASFSLTSNGPVSLGSFNDPSKVVSFSAPNATVTGSVSFGQVSQLRIGAAVNAFIETGSGYASYVNIPNVTNTSLHGNYVASINSKQWLNTDGGTYNVSANILASLTVPGTFADNLAITNTGYSIQSANVGSPTGVWDMSGSALHLVVGTPGSGWGINSNGLLRSLTIKGNFTNQVTAAAITSMTVGGTTTGAVVQTDATFSKKFTQIQHLSFAKAVTNSVIFSAGNIGSISAPSLTGSRIYAGVEIAEAQNGGLAVNASNLSNDAKITSVSLGNGASAFSNSLINADIIGSLHLGKIASSNGGSVHGIAAHTIGSVSGTLVPGGVINAGPAQLKNATTFAAYVAKKKLTLGDFEVVLF